MINSRRLFNIGPSDDTTLTNKYECKSFNCEFLRYVKEIFLCREINDSQYPLLCINLDQDIYFYNLESLIQTRKMLYYIQLPIYYCNNFMMSTPTKYTNMNTK